VVMGGLLRSDAVLQAGTSYELAGMATTSYDVPREVIRGGGNDDQVV
jgi:hypothetical protein